MAPESGRNRQPIDPNKIAYVYMQLADYIAGQITDGTLRPGARLPGERDLAAEYGVAHLTIRRATKELRERGLVITLPGKGTFIAYPEPESDTSEGDDSDGS
ncbi:winged helix-turn-helix domain-containing protein [Streptomyces sp. NPDC051684]|uniref:winged helix-turn-helix domain-containing protein n=1 Tax=Streptomyces sp. NPDC051684 TaxID=3365670 RepID=UPI0037A574EA